MNSLKITLGPHDVRPAASRVVGDGSRYATYDVDDTPIVLRSVMFEGSECVQIFAPNEMVSVTVSREMFLVACRGTRTFFLS